MKAGKVERYLLERIESEGAIHITLIDPEKSPPEEAVAIASAAERGGSSAIMVGGSTLVSTEDLDRAIIRVKEEVELPVILFPNNVSAISRYADAIWFMSLLNSTNTYYLVDAQMLGAPLVKRYGLEAIPMGYIILGEGGVVGFVGHARPISYDHPELAAAYALAAQYLGMRFVYLEAGSGVRSPIPPPVVRAVKGVVDIPVIVGGGIRSGDDAKMLVEAGADVVVTGTLAEEGGVVEEKINNIVRKIRHRGRKS